MLYRYFPNLFVYSSEYQPEALWTIARVVCELIAAFAAILAGICVDAAEGNLVLAELALVSCPAPALVLAHLVHARRVVLAQVLQTIVHVQFAAHPGEPALTLAPEVKVLDFIEGSRIRTIS
jgi:hypothetical protein